MTPSCFSSILFFTLTAISSIAATSSDTGFTHGAPDEFYAVTVKSKQDCSDGTPSGTLSVRVLTSAGLPVKGADLDFLLVADSGNTYSGQARTNRRGRSSFSFDVELADEGESLWCSVAVENPSLPNPQQVSCSVVVDCN